MVFWSCETIRLKYFFCIEAFIVGVKTSERGLVCFRAVYSSTNRVSSDDWYLSGNQSDDMSVRRPVGRYVRQSWSPVHDLLCHWCHFVVCHECQLTFGHQVACEKVAKLRYQTIIYRTNADIVILPPFGPGVFLPMSIYWLALERWHAICSTCNIYSSTNRVSSDDWYLSWQPFGWYVCSTTSRMLCPREMISE